MKKILFLSIVFLTSCTPALQQASAQSLPGTVTISTATSLPDTTPTLIVPSPTTIPAPCDPFVEDYCITDGHFLFQNPIFPPGNTFVDITYRYGSTENNTREPHHGVEFLNEYGTPVHAAGDGVVQFAGSDTEALYTPWKNFYGNLVVIRHANEMYTLYAHLSGIEIQAGDDVQAGDLIGEVGQTGVATGSHLHFEVRQGGDGTDYYSTQNPELWLIPNKDSVGKSLGAISFSIVDKTLEFHFVEFTTRHHVAINGAKVKSYYVVTYAKDMMLGEENAALGDLPPGFYRVALKYYGQLYERWVEVKSGKLTQVVITLN